MADVREAILLRILDVVGAIDGIVATGRMVADVKGLARPAVLLHDGPEQALDLTPGERRSRVQLVEMSPLITLKISADAGAIGSLLNIYRGRLLAALGGDADLATLITTNGAFRYDSWDIEPITLEAKEAVATLGVVFTYPFRLSDL